MPLIQKRLHNRGFPSTEIKHPGDHVLESNINAFYQIKMEPIYTVVKGKLIQFRQLSQKVLNFLGGIGYSGLISAECTNRITLSNNISFGNHPSVRRIMKKVFEARPSLPKLMQSTV